MTLPRNLFVLALAAGLSAAQGQVAPLIHAHSHNDEQHARPLREALEHGFSSVEADTWLLEGKLLVGHDRAQLRSTNGLQRLYLQPLRKLAKENGGKIYPNGGHFYLLIDVKSDADKTYAALRALFQEYADMLTAFRSGKIERKAVTVVISGNRAREMMAREAVRYAALDGRLSDLSGADPNDLVLWISDDWRKHFKWRGQGAMPEAEKARVKEIAQKTHGQGKLLRFWNTPEGPAAWGELRALGVDLLNSDHLAALEGFLRTTKEP